HTGTESMGVLTRRVSPVVILLVLLLIGLQTRTRAAGTIRSVPAGGDLQAALNAAQPGDEVVLQAGARFTGEFTLPVKPAGAAITIRSSATLPARRIGPADASLLPILVSGTVMPALDGTGSSNWRLDGLSFESTVGGEGEIVTLQDS